MQTAEISGIITKVDFPKFKNDTTKFTVFFPNSQKSYNAICSFYCPMRVGDTIQARCVIDAANRLHVSSAPWVQPQMDRDSVVQCFIKAIRDGYKPAQNLYNTVSKLAGGDENVISFLTNVAQKWNDTHDAELLFMFGNSNIENIKKLFNWWHKERNLRRLYLFGLTKKEINASRMTCDNIFRRIMKNPYSLPAIPMEKCATIMDQLSRKTEVNDHIRGLIIRAIWKNLNENAWTGTPHKFLIKQFPEINNHLDYLKQDYDVIFDLNTYYLEFPHKAEVAVANFLINLVKQDTITYDTPLDQTITLPDGRVIKRLSAYNSGELSEDQQKAIQGALDHSCSIITGAAGTGKCLALGTKILMFDGSIKKIEDIKVGEQVMGPDSKPRNVISKCSGIDNMYEIKPSEGRSYVFNEPHVLTLKGIESFIENDPKKNKSYIVRYSEKGLEKSKAFLTKEEAQLFLDSLSEDIFDIPLNEFMNRSKQQQKYSYLFHTGIDFPHKDVPLDPYLIGYWLGDGSNAGTQIVQEHEIKSTSGKDLNYGVNNKFLQVLREYNMLNNKHIPDIYKINSREVRLKLLAGLIDSDGYSYKGCIEIIQKNKKLADDIEYLAFSLGFMVTKTECVKGEMHNGTYQRMEIFGEGLQEIPVILERKKPLPREIKKRATCLRFEIIPKGKGMYCGFELDSDGRFLLEDFLVTHNTTVLGQIVKNLDLRQVSYAVCSFTGKAVARIREVTKKRTPATIHRLISNTRKNQLDKRSSQFEKDIPLADYEYILIDETSMVTTELMYDFIQAYPNIKHMVFVGDVNQLAPIGWGNLFAQIIKSETIPTYKLTTNYRTYTANGEQDGIILNANEIINHDPIAPFQFYQTSNFMVIDGNMDRAFDIVKGCFGAGIKSDQIAILTPYNRCLDSLNKKFQDIYNIGARSVTDSRGVKWMIGDRVMMLINDSDIGVFNGETGIIRDLNDKAILVDFSQSGMHEFLLEPTIPENRNYYGQGQTRQYYKRGNMAEEVLDGDEGDDDDERTVKKLRHAYALTIDKSQGSEWDFIILYIDEFNKSLFINKNRIYTAITRAKRCVWCVVPDIHSLEEASMKQPPYRCDNLCLRLCSELPHIAPFKLIKPPSPQDMADDYFDPDDDSLFFDDYF